MSGYAKIDAAGPRPPVVILCGGVGSRLHEETEFRPKPMLEIGGRPILWHIMKLYAHYGFRDFILCLGYKGRVIKEFFRNYRMYRNDMTLRLGQEDEIEYHGNCPEEDWRVVLVETGQSAQTGCRVARAARYIEGPTFCLTYGDGLGDVDLGALMAFHRSHGKVGTVTGVRPPGRFGELEVDSRGRVTHFKQKPQVTSGIINGGFFVFERPFLEKHLEDRDDLHLEEEPLRSLSEAGELMVYPHSGFWQPMDTYREYRLLNELWDSGKAPWKVWR